MVIEDTLRTSFQALPKLKIAVFNLPSLVQLLQDVPLVFRKGYRCRPLITYYKSN
jgi:hypothetical protein